MSNPISRRHFLKTILYSGAMASCGPLLSSPQATVSSDPPPTWLALENDAVSYSGNGISCNRTTIRGVIVNEYGKGVPGVMVRVNAGDGSFSGEASSGGEGRYEIDVDSALSDTEFQLQAYSADGVMLSELIIVPAIPDCKLNIMTVNFIPG
jgi:hypothetical protein